MHRLLASRHVDTFVASAVMTAGILAVSLVLAGWVLGLVLLSRLVEGWL